MTASVRALATLTVVLYSFPAYAQTVFWNAGPDMVANESSGATETINPNTVVPAWSYGWRTTALSTGLTLFTGDNHVNDASGLEGFFYSAGNGPGVLVNATAGNILISTGPGLLDPLAPGEIDLDPSFSGQFTVVRWTAPTAGTFSITADWRDLDPYGGDGTAANLVFNGVAVFNYVMPNGGTAALGAPMLLTLAAGDKLDFVLDALGNGLYDSTAFNATITAIPEPPLTALLLGGFAISALLRRGICGIRGIRGSM
jgi:hypothetical protein